MKRLLFKPFHFLSRVTTSNLTMSFIARKGFTLAAHTVRKTANKGGFRSFASDESLVKTALNDLHKELGGDMVPFAGYELPVLYKGENGGVMKEHLWCRADKKAALFDGMCEFT